MERGFLLGVNYDGKEKKAIIKFYNPEKEIILKVADSTGHRPYCLTDLTKEEVQKVLDKEIQQAVLSFKEVTLFDTLLNKKRKFTKIEVEDPLWISGRRNSIREVFERKKLSAHLWEDKIKYRNNYIYDHKLIIGEEYLISESGSLKRVEKENGKNEKWKNLFREELLFDPEVYKETANWFKLLSATIPNITRTALDIEVFSPKVGRIPYAKEANYPVIAATLVSNKSERKIFLLKRVSVKEGNLESLKERAKVYFFNSEQEMIREIFNEIKNIPLLVTFNGDNFDLPYLAHRAEKLGINRKEIPLKEGKDSFKIEPGLHLDLYKFFHNRSIQVYAFSERYRNATLDEVSTALLSKGKIELEEEISQLTLEQLAKYCLRDSELTMELTTFNDGLVMNLIILISKISRLSLEDVTRTGVSAWIRNLLNYEHRKRGLLIPNSEDIIEKKGEAKTKSVIQGKKYKGAVIIPPAEGVHFNVTVLDFASLYPSLIKSRNLSYETINCNDPGCRGNKVPDTPHWVCTRRRGLISVLMGSLRDVRVRWFKPKSKAKDLPVKEREKNKVIQQALKVILNASYGVLGAETFSYYCPPVAESITAYGRHLIIEVMKESQRRGIKVIYGDTDSVFLEKPPKKVIEELMRWVEEKFSIDMDIDKIYRYVALSKRKKNYIGVYLDGTVDIKGLIGKKKNTPPFIKTAFYEMVEILGKVKTEQEFKEAKKEIQKIIKEKYLALKNKTFNLEDLSFKVSLTKPLNRYTKTTPQHVKAARMLEKKGVNIEPGDTINFIKTKGKIGVKPLSLTKKSEIDIDKYVETLKTTFEQVLDALNLDFDEIIGSKTLESFFN